VKKFAYLIPAVLTLAACSAQHHHRHEHDHRAGREGVDLSRAAGHQDLNRRPPDPQSDARRFPLSHNDSEVPLTCANRLTVSPAEAA